MNVIQNTNFCLKNKEISENRTDNKRDNRLIVILLGYNILIKYEIQKRNYTTKW